MVVPVRALLKLYVQMTLTHKLKLGKIVPEVYSVFIGFNLVIQQMMELMICNGKLLLAYVQIQALVLTRLLLHYLITKQE